MSDVQHRTIKLNLLSFAGNGFFDSQEALFSVHPSLLTVVKISGKVPIYLQIYNKRIYLKKKKIINLLNLNQQEFGLHL